MYGLVNKAMKDLVVKKFGDSSWLQICRQAGYEAPEFADLQSYPDELTYKLVGSASKVLNLPAADLLEEFGRHWVLYTADEGYGEMLKAAGNSLPEFLQNLDMLHTRVGNLMPKLNPPSFECSDITDRSLTLIYRSSRQGLTPMVVGLLKGLGSRFGKECEVTMLGMTEHEGCEATFRVDW